MLKTVNFADLQKNVRTVVDWASNENDTVVVEKYGRPLVVILPFNEYENYLTFREKWSELPPTGFEWLRWAAEQNAAFNNLSEEEAFSLAEQAREEVYQLKIKQAAVVEGT